MSDHRKTTQIELCQLVDRALIRRKLSLAEIERKLELNVVSNGGKAR